MRVGGKIDERGSDPRVLAAAKTYMITSLFFSQADAETLFHTNTSEQKTGAIVSPWRVTSKEPPPSLTAEAILLQERDRYFKNTSADGGRTAHADSRISA